MLVAGKIAYNGGVRLTGCPPATKMPFSRGFPSIYSYAFYPRTTCPFGRQTYVSSHRLPRLGPEGVHGISNVGHRPGTSSTTVAYRVLGLVFYGLVFPAQRGKSRGGVKQLAGDVPRCRFLAPGVMLCVDVLLSCVPLL